MEREKKMEYIIKLLIWIGLVDDKIPYLENELLQKDERMLDEVVTKLENYYTNRSRLDEEFIRKLHKMGNTVDEMIESTVEKFNLDNFNNLL